MKNFLNKDYYNLGIFSKHLITIALKKKESIYNRGGKIKRIIHVSPDAC
jgi:hypothetical protein